MNENKNTTILIAAGGTGGHLYPGIAIARELKAKGFSPLFAVRKDDPCRAILEEEKCSFVEIPIRGMPRSLSPKLFVFGYLLLKSLARASGLLREIRPAVILGMGGYISFPLILIGRLQGIPTIIHEQNYIPGLANKIASKFVRYIAVSFKESVAFFPKKKTVVTGNPVRKELFAYTRDTGFRCLKLDKDKFTVLVFGGSLGAAKINQTVVESFAYLTEVKGRMQFLHISGNKDYERMEKIYQEQAIPGKVYPYLHGIGEAYAVADLIICRSGATTIAELQILNKPAIFVPYPFATANHQEYNARVLVDAGKGKIIIEKNLTPELLAKEIIDSIAHASKEMPLAMPEIYAQQRIAEIVAQLAGNQ
jgi:UDP-N-acetylglucosamine--N-acetylmuramyl-(pentapeptide) pyrophosphoryl-undecaprenol N-acetylglucosamine transferase